MFSLIIAIVSTLMSVITGVAVLVLNWRRAANFLYGITSLSYILLGVTNYLSTQAIGDNKLFFARLVMVFTATSVMLTYYLVVTLLLRKDDTTPLRNKSLLIKTVVSLGIVFVIALCLSPFVISGVEGRGVVFGPGIFIFITYMGIFTVGAMRVMVRIVLAEKAPQQLRSQAKYLLIGYLPVVFIAPITGIYLPAVHGDLRLIALTPAYSALFVIMISYTMVRHRLFDLRPYLLRAFVYLLISLTISVLYIAPIVYFIGGIVIGYVFTWPEFIAAVVLATIAGYNFERLRSWFDIKTSQVFFRDAYDSASLLGELNKTLVTTIDLDKVLKDSAQLIIANMKSEYCTFLLKGSDTKDMRVVGINSEKPGNSKFLKLQKEVSRSTESTLITDFLPIEYSELKDALIEKDVAILIRLSVASNTGKTDLGYILLGYKKSGNPFTSQDVHTLESIADVLVIAIQNALHFEEIQKFNITLQQRVNEATAQLRRTNAKLKALDETKDDFISMASHQLRTPLTSVKGYLSMVLEGDAGKLTPMQRKMLDQAFVSSQRMVFLIADLLNVSRLKTGKFVIEPSRVNLAKTVSDEINQLKESAKNRSLELVYEKPASFPDLMLDETKIRQVIMNFIDNAIYYTKPGGRIRVELLENEGTIEFRVYDTGIGVPKQERQHLFTKFYRAGNARQSRPDGTGLGLFMAKKVVVAHGGAVIFDSEENKGSVFGFIFSKRELAPQATLKEQAAKGA